MTGIEIVLLAALGAVLGWTLITGLVLTITMIAAHHDDASHHGPLTPVLDAEGLPVVRTVGDLTPRHIGRQVRIADPVDGDSEGEMTGIDAWPGFFTVWLDQSTAIRCPPRYPARGAAVSRPDRQEHMHSDWGWCSLAAGNRGFCPGGIVDSYLDHSDKRVEGWSTVIRPTWGALLVPPRPRRRYRLRRLPWPDGHALHTTPPMLQLRAAATWLCGIPARVVGHLVSWRPTRGALGDLLRARGGRR